MSRALALGGILGLVLLLAAPAGCKLVENEPGGTVTGPAAVPGGDMAAMVAEIWEPQVMPHLRDRATDMATLAPAIAADPDEAGAAHGHRAGSEGSPWNFATRIDGRIVAAKTDTRAATADVDVDGDGTADAVLQLGPIIRGTALRDVLPFIDFTSFTDQIEFAQLSRALNTMAYEGALKDLPRDGLVGLRVTALGVFTLTGKPGAPLVTPVEAGLAAP